MAAGDMRHVVQFGIQFLNPILGSLGDQLRPLAVALAGAVYTALRARQLGSGPHFCVVLGRSLHVSEHLFLYL